MFPASTKGGGVVIAFPDTCKTPSPGGPVAIPYPNGTYEVKNSAAKSSRKSIISSAKVSLPHSYSDEAGTSAGVVSSITMGKSVGNTALLMHLVDKAQEKGFKVIIDVKAEGKAVIRLQGTIQHNYSTTRSSSPALSTKRAPRMYIAHSGTEGMEWLLRHLD